LKTKKSTFSRERDGIWDRETTVEIKAFVQWMDQSGECYGRSNPGVESQ
jgi:hypothetical protein